MKANEFPGLPSASSVVAAVTFTVSAWFLAAGGLMLTEKPGEHAIESTAPQATAVTYTAPPVAIAPEARLLIVVEGRRA